MRSAWNEWTWIKMKKETKRENIQCDLSVGNAHAHTRSDHIDTSTQRKYIIFVSLNRNYAPIGRLYSAPSFVAPDAKSSSLDEKKNCVVQIQCLIKASESHSITFSNNSFVPVNQSHFSCNWIRSIENHQSLGRFTHSKFAEHVLRKFSVKRN